MIGIMNNEDIEEILPEDEEKEVDNKTIKAIIDDVSIGISDFSIQDDGLVSFTYGIINGVVKDKTKFNEDVNKFVMKLIEQYNNDRDNGKTDI
jgi:predicted transcriptional regulator